MTQPEIDYDRELAEGQGAKDRQNAAILELNREPIDQLWRNLRLVLPVIARDFWRTPAGSNRHNTRQRLNRLLPKLRRLQRGDHKPRSARWLRDQWSEAIYIARRYNRRRELSPEKPALIIPPLSREVMTEVERAFWERQWRALAATGYHPDHDMPTPLREPAKRGPRFRPHPQSTV